VTGGPSPLPPEQQERERQLANGAIPQPAPAGFPMMPPQSPQRFQCAVCVGVRRAWEEANRPALEAAQARVIMAMQNGSAPPDMRLLLGEDLVAAMPQVAEAITMATLPNAGPALVCGGHTPLAAEPSAPGKRPFLIATAGVNLAQFAAGVPQ
jgi:hypothetical protein